jgi:HEAT repeat protein
VKQQAVKDLAKFGDEAKPAVPELMKCLTLGDVAFKQEVLGLIKKLGGVPGRGDLDLMVKLLDDKAFPDGRLFALDGLLTVGADAKPALPGLLAVLKDNDPPTRRKAIAIIGNIGPDARDQVLKQFIGYLKDSDAETVKAAQEALPKLGKPAKNQVSILAESLRDANDNVRKYSMTALADLGPDAEGAMEDLITAARGDKLAELRKAALAIIVKLKPKDQLTIDLMTGALKDLDPGVNLAAVAALAEVGPTGGALAGLIQALDHKNDDVRKAAEDAFRKATFDKSQVNGLATVLNTNKSPRVRMEIVDALGRLKADAADAAESLGKIAKDSDGDLRLKAIQALAEIGPAGKKGAASLVDVMNDKNEKNDTVRIEAAMAITKMEAPEAKQALPIVIKGLYVTDETDAKQTERRDKVSKVLVAIGKPAADPLAKTLDPTGDFYNAKVSTAEGMAMARARKQVLEILLEMGPKNGKTGTSFLILSKVSKEDPSGEVRQLAKKAYDAFQM